MCTTYGIEHHMISPGISRGNGQVERYVDTVANLLRTNIEKVSDWVAYLSKIQLALNTTQNKTTKLSPLKILTGIDGKTPDLGPLLNDLNIEIEYDDIAEIRKHVSKRIKISQIEQKIRFDKSKAHCTKLNIGDMVVYKNSQIRKSKLDVHYQGVFEIIGILPNDRYKLKKGGSKLIVTAAREQIRVIP